MPMDVEIMTNVKENELTIKSCQELLDALEKTYATIRLDIYDQLLGFKTQRRALLVIMLLGVFYLLTKDRFYLYMLLPAVGGVLLSAVIMAELMIKSIKKQLKLRIAYFQKKLLQLKNQSYSH